MPNYNEIRLHLTVDQFLYLYNTLKGLPDDTDTKVLTALVDYFDDKYDEKIEKINARLYRKKNEQAVLKQIAEKRIERTVPQQSEEEIFAILAENSAMVQAKRQASAEETT